MLRLKEPAMQTTMQLFERALSHHKQAEWARLLNLTEAALSQAKKRGRLSPTMAGSIATQLGENPTQWIAIAAIEAEPDSPAKKALVRALNIAKL
ncbi:hypothetical protein DSI38_01760, partial [Mycobacterium tuberculosis]